MPYYNNECSDILVTPTVPTIHAFSPLPPLQTRKISTSISSYRMTSPTLLSRHKIGAQYGTDRYFRNWQLSTSKYKKSPSPSDQPIFPAQTNVKRITRRDLKVGNIPIEAVEAQIARNAHKQDNVVYLTPWEYESRIWEAMGWRRGSKSKPEESNFSHVVAKSNHLTYEHLFGNI